MDATNKKLLEDAARAAGFPLAEGWNPLEDDGQALRLAVKLNLKVGLFRAGTDKAAGAGAWIDGSSEITPDFWSRYGNDPAATTRYVIVRAAAHIGRTT